MLLQTRFFFFLPPSRLNVRSLAEPGKTPLHSFPGPQGLGGTRTRTNAHRGKSPLWSQPYARGAGREKAFRLPPSFALRQ